MAAASASSLNTDRLRTCSAHQRWIEGEELLSLADTTQGEAADRDELRALTRIVSLEDGERAIADKLQHVAASFVNGRDHRLGVVVEERNDLVRGRVVGYAREAAKIGEPQDRVDAVGNASRDATAQDALAG